MVPANNDANYYVDHGVRLLLDPSVTDEVERLVSRIS